MRAITCPSVESSGSYAQAIAGGGLVFVSGQVGVEADGSAVPGGVGPQTRRAMRNIEAVLGAAGLDLAAIAAVTVHLASREDLPAFNAAYLDVLGDHRPARTTVVSALLEEHLGVEITVIAVRR